MRLATEEDFKSLPIGTPVIVNIADLVSDIGLYISYNFESKKATVLDCFSKGIEDNFHANFCDYARVFLLELNDKDLLKLSK